MTDYDVKSSEIALAVLEEFNRSGGELPSADSKPLDPSEQFIRDEFLAQLLDPFGPLQPAYEPSKLLEAPDPAAHLAKVIAGWMPEGRASKEEEMYWYDMGICHKCVCGTVLIVTDEEKPLLVKCPFCPAYWCRNHWTKNPWESFRMWMMKGTEEMQCPFGTLGCDQLAS